MPTMLEAAGIPVPKEVQGKSFLKMLFDEKTGPTHTEIYTEMDEHVRYIPCRAVRTDRYKYIKNYSDNPFGLDMNNHDEWAHRLCLLPGHSWKRPRPEEEFYDLLKDPTEQKNLARNPSYAGELQKHRKLLYEHMIKTGDPILGKSFTKDFKPEEYAPVKPGHKYLSLIHI